jgi:hypothetical protein
MLSLRISYDSHVHDHDHFHDLTSVNHDLASLKWTNLYTMYLSHNENLDAKRAVEARYTTRHIVTNIVKNNDFVSNHSVNSVNTVYKLN